LIEKGKHGMENKKINLRFDDFELTAELFDTRVAGDFARGIPYDVKLTQWGNEVYGSIGKDLGEENPVDKIPPGGIAYTGRGNYVCIFFGQDPAWPVEYIGQVTGDDWKGLVDAGKLDTVRIGEIIE